MDELWSRLVENLSAIASGPMKFRLLLQPLLAVIFAVRAGIADAKAGRPPYFWALLWDRAHRRAMLRDGWKSIGHLFLIALLLDVIYQLLVARYVYPLESIFVAFLLAVVPYLILRGPVSRVVR